MASRYSRIRDANQLVRALENLRAYEDQERTPRVNSQGARDKQIPVYVVPFGRDILSTEVVRVNNSQPSYTALETLVNNGGGSGSVTNTAGTKTVITMNGFRPARVVWFRNAQRIVSTETSDVTRIQYLKYDGTRSTCAFGRGVDGDNMYDSFEAIKTAILTANPSLEVNRVSLQREKISYR